jgi:hypothetical protein
VIISVSHPGMMILPSKPEAYLSRRCVWLYDFLGCGGLLKHMPLENVMAGEFVRFSGDAMEHILCESLNIYIILNDKV